ncbi:MAG: bifunctional metallophosphatase/5'-nucleotidase [Selenomonadaceae bacterium]|nr:bifunctional metallophosphatase/5'-nucleotidase [Selenomonadaceae bacterium]
MFKKFFGALIVSLMIFGSTICAAAELVIFHTNDMHSRIQKGDDGGNSIGLAEISAAVKTTKKNNPMTLWLDAGDTVHGMPIINLSDGKNIVPLLNEAGIDAMTTGNHDYNYGSKQLEKLAKSLKFPVLAANVVRKGTDKNLFKSYKIFTRNGIKIGVFGLATPETAYKTSPVNVTTVDFLNPVDKAREMIKILRPKCDVVIALVHLGVDASSEFTSERLARETDGIDLIVDGHSHTALYEGTRIKDTLIVQSGCYEHFLGRATIELDGNKIISKKAELLDADAVKSINPTPDEKLLAKLDVFKKETDKILDEVVAHSDKRLSGERLLVRRNESELGNLTADAYRWAAKTDIAICGGGDLRTDLPEGDVTRRDILAIFPFGNTIQTAEISGAQIREMLEHSVEFYPASFGGFLNVSGMTFSYDPSKPPKHRVEEILVNGQPLDENKIYTIAMNDFLSSGGDDYTMLANLKPVGNFGSYEDIFAKYLNEVGMKNYEIGRITRLVEVPIPDAQ